ncbi:MAG: hypothetical protein Q7T11_07855 [Deltaproteobacteria bacterium]|nr:hypothetical protein [Deltaproteobacteria bacterium]
MNRPNIHFRGYCGTVASGRVAKGDKIVVLPSGKGSVVKSIVTSNGELKEAFTPQAVTLTLEDEIDISRGDTILHEKNVFKSTREIEATLVWMNEQKLECGKQYWIKQTTNTVIGVIEEVEALINVDTLEESKTKTLELNEIGKVRVTLNKALVIDAYKNNRALGAFIVIDRLTNATVAAGMIADQSSEKKPGGLGKLFNFLRR